jgi:hypothetical protein
MSSTTDQGSTSADLQTSFSQAASASTSAGGQEKKESTASLQIAGQVVEENEYVRLGAFHTLDLEGELGGLEERTLANYSQSRFPFDKDIGMGLGCAGKDLGEYERRQGGGSGCGCLWRR